MQKMKCIQGIRGIAIFLIVLWHLNSVFPNCLPAFGDRGVEFFFLISGFLIGLKYYDSGKMNSPRQTLRYAYEPIHAGKGWKNAIVTWYQKFKESVFFRRLFFLAFVTSLILFRTLLNRQLWMNPLSDVMGGWGIWETVNGEQKLTTECIENVIMMVPFTSMVIWTFQEKVGSSWKKILWYSGKVAFIFSISIEMLQLFLRLGTFQLSDLFYNTVGGMIGGLMYYGIAKAKKHL